jgi:hypothetical protein
MARRLLMIAYHFPPCVGSSGLQRTLSFSKHLYSFGWNPIILAPHLRAYQQIGNDQLGDISSETVVKRAFALDTTRHLGIKGRYPLWLALPDRWASWLIGAIPAGLRIIRKHRPDVLWSTYPIATAHLIGFFLHRLTNIPWVADFRDPMNEIDPISGERWPKDPRIWSAREWIERRTVLSCSRAVFVTPAALQICAKRYPEVPGGRFALIANGYSEESFSAAAALSKGHRPPTKKLVLLHSGVLYPTPDRDPTHFFDALAKLRSLDEISPENLQVILRASSSEDLYQKKLRDLGIEDIVKLEPPLPYKQALAEMLDVDGLLLFQGRDSNSAVPAKLYEYLRAQRPVFAMVDDEGDTATELRRAKVGTIVPLSSTVQIIAGLREFLQQVRERTSPVLSDTELRHYSREEKAKDLAQMLDSVWQEAQLANPASGPG